MLSADELYPDDVTSGPATDTAVRPTRPTPHGYAAPAVDGKDSPWKSPQGQRPTDSPNSETVRTENPFARRSMTNPARPDTLTAKTLTSPQMERTWRNVYAKLNPEPEYSADAPEPWLSWFRGKAHAYAKNHYLWADGWTRNQFINLNVIKAIKERGAVGDARRAWRILARMLHQHRLDARRHDADTQERKEEIAAKYEHMFDTGEKPVNKSNIADAEYMPPSQLTPMERTAAEPPHAAWIDDDGARRAFFKLWGELWGERVAKAGAPADTTKQDDYRKKWLKVHTKTDSLKGWNDSADALLSGLRNALDFDYPIKEQPAATPARASGDDGGETAARTADVAPAAVVVPETPKSGLVDPSVNAEKGIPMTYPNWPESPVVVYPMQNGGVRYKGVKFSVTLRFGGSIDMAIPLMDDFLEKARQGVIEIDPSCLVREPSAAPQSFQPVAQPIAPVHQPAPVPSAAPAPAPTSGASNVVSIREIKKFQDEGKTRYELYENPGDQKPALIVRPPAMVKRLLAPYIAVDSLTPGTRYAINWRCEWKEGGLKENGDHWHDLSAVTVLAAA